MTENMNENEKTVITIILGTLDTLNDGLNKLSRYSNNGINELKIKVAELTKDVENLQTRACPRGVDEIIEIIDIERLRNEEKKREKLMKFIVWVLAIVGGSIALILSIEQIIQLIKK